MFFFLDQGIRMLIGSNIFKIFFESLAIEFHIIFNI